MLAKLLLIAAMVSSLAFAQGRGGGGAAGAAGGAAETNPAECYACRRARPKANSSATSSA